MLNFDGDFGGSEQWCYVWIHLWWPLPEPLLEDPPSSAEYSLPSNHAHTLCVPRSEWDATSFCGSLYYCSDLQTILTSRVQTKVILTGSALTPSQWEHACCARNSMLTDHFLKSAKFEIYFCNNTLVLIFSEDSMFQLHQIVSINGCQRDRDLLLSKITA